MTSSPMKRDNADQNKLITGIRTTMDSFLTDLRDEKLYCISHVIDIWEYCREHFVNSDTATTMV